LVTTKMLIIKEIIDISRIAFIAAYGYCLSRFGQLKQAIDKFYDAANLAEHHPADCLMPKPRRVTQNILRELLFFSLRQGGFAAYRAKNYVYAYDVLTMAENECDRPDKKTLLCLGLLGENTADFAESAYYYRTVLQIDPNSGVAVSGLYRCHQEMERIGELEKQRIKLTATCKRDCLYFISNSPIKCAVNPAGSCDSCRDYFPVPKEPSLYNDYPF
jgi:tetratricopeptide (TPR) repeat protein